MSVDIDGKCLDGRKKLKKIMNKKKERKNIFCESYNRHNV